jgi:serine/threonine-protein kinase
MTPASQIGHYRLTSKLGEGGMGAVYRATDTKLNRDVALKVLPEAFRADAGRMARFEREAQLLAALNHPNIAAIYGTEQGAIVMELAIGEDLAGPLPIETAIAYAKQIAAGLEAAHEKGIVHRDLKPANIKVTADGVVKLLDFGLAKATEETGGNPVNSPTMSLTMTQAGAILGTAAYMAPEQARGKAVDKRADIWAFGVVLYEMLTGRILYGAGETITDIIAAVVTREPDWNALPAGTPPRVRRLLERCLRKDPKQRLRDIGEARVILDEAEEAAPVATAARTPKTPWIVAAAMGVAALGAGAMAWRGAGAPAPGGASRFDVNFGRIAVEGQRSTDLISPDGRRIVFTGHAPDGRVALYTRTLDETNASMIPGTELPAYIGEATFSPDGQWIAFYGVRELQKVALNGGAPITLCPTGWVGGISWGEDGTIVFSSSSAGAGRLYRIAASGGEPQPIGEDPKDSRSSPWGPQILPGGQQVLYTALRGYYDSTNNEIRVASLKGGAEKVVYRGATWFARYLPSGHLAFIRDNTLYAVRFDLDTLEMRGTPVPILYDIAAFRASGPAKFEVSKNGTLLYVPRGAVAEKWPLAWLDASGKSTAILPPALYQAPSISPDGRRVAYSLRTEKATDLWVYDFARETPTQLTFDAPRSGTPEVVWTPDGRHILYGAQLAEGASLMSIRSDGSGQPHRLLTAAGNPRPHSFSPDGRTLVYSLSPGGVPDLWTVKLDLSDPDRPKAGTPEVFLATLGVEVDGVVSPDGRWMAYASSESGAEDLFVRPFPAGSNGNGKYRVSTQGGKFPSWSRDGRTLFFLGGDNRIMAADCSAKGATFDFSRPRQWSPAPVQRTIIIRNLDLHPDGKRFVVFPAADDGARGAVHATFVLNFFDELKRRVP